MSYLLDTHALLWWLNGTDLSEAALTVLSDSQSEVFVSPISAIEMSIKSSRGRVSVPDDLPHLITDSGFETLAIRPPVSRPLVSSSVRPGTPGVHAADQARDRAD